MTNNVVIDKDAAFDLIDELRAAIPEEIRAAKRINSEGERIIEKAQEEAERIVASAQEQAAFLIEERGLTAAAEEASGRIIGQAQDESAEVRRGADEYAASVLIGLEGEVVRTLQSIKKGITLLDERRDQSRARPIAVDAGGDGEVDEDVDDLGRRARSRGGAGDPLRQVVTRAAPRDRLPVNVATLLGEPGGSVRDLAFKDLELDLGDDLTLAEPADARFRLTRTNRGLLVDGDVHATLAETCSRCLRPIVVEVAQEIDEEALQSVELATGARIDHADEPEVARIYRPSRDRARAVRPRGDPAGGADRASVPAGLPRPVRGMRRGAGPAARTTTARSRSTHASRRSGRSRSMTDDED